MIDKNLIIKKVKESGLHIDRRGNIYGSEYEPYISLRGGLWQKPHEIADLLILLQKQNIKTFLNIGTFNGVTFNFISDFLNSINTTICVTVDPYKYQHNSNQIENSEPLEKKIPYIYVTGTSNNFKEEYFDFVFIDGLHQYDALQLDWDNVGKYAKVIAFHDINDQDCPDVVRFWKDLIPKVEKDFIVQELIEPTPNRNLMGIGVLIRRGY
jgi:hypothetical protein